tara:strand:- start:329 stop:688 length:360 start_codon:yes stop_codon:yes gene_type:complete
MNRTEEYIFEECIKNIKSKIGNIEINQKNIIYIVKISMEAVEITNTKGTEQKILVNRIISKLILDAPISKNEKEELLSNIIDNGILDEVIEIVVSATKNELDINVPEKVTMNCCMRLFK